VTLQRRRATDPRRAAHDPLAFLPGVAEKLGYYVYALRDPRNGELFYVGKGKGQRAYQHARRGATARRGAEEGLKLARIRAICERGLYPEVEIIRHELSEDEAFTVEAGVLDALKLTGLELTTEIAGHGAGRGWEPFADLVVRYRAKPVKILPEHPVVLIRLNREQWQDDKRPLYERTRKWWRMGDRRLRANWAFSVYDGIVRAVYRIEGWEQPTQRDLKGNPQRRGRWAFRGTQDAELEKRYFSADVRAELGARGSQYPIRYINCGPATLRLR
jgi:uncharacterized protein